MVMGNFITSLESFASALPADLSSTVFQLIFILKTLGVFAIIYIIYNIAIGVASYYRMKKVDHIMVIVEEISKKVDSIEKRLNRPKGRKKN